VSHLRTLAVNQATPVGEAFEALLDADWRSSYASMLPRRATGPADSVALFSPVLPWGDFVGALAASPLDAERCVWVRELCSWDAPAAVDAAARFVGVAELLLPAAPERLETLVWSPAACAVSRDAEVVLVPCMSAKGRDALAVAMADGLPQRFYDALLAPKAGAVGCSGMCALATVLRGIVDDKVGAEHTDALLGQLACATGDYITAQTHFDRTRDVAACAELELRQGRYAQARELLERVCCDGLQDDDDDGAHATQQQRALQLADVLHSMGKNEAAVRCVEDVLADCSDDEVRADCFSRLARLHDARDSAFESLECARAALRIQRALGNTVATADALLQLGRLELNAAASKDAAFAHLVDALAAFASALGEMHPKTLACEKELARANVARDDPAAAVALLRRVNEQYALLYGSKHAAAMGAKSQLANALLLGGWRREGVDQLAGLHALQVETFGVDSEQATKTARRLARLQAGEPCP